jgi:hypothetical protein
MSRLQGQALCRRSVSSNSSSRLISRSSPSATVGTGEQWALALGRRSPRGAERFTASGPKAEDRSPKKQDLVRAEPATGCSLGAVRGPPGPGRQGGNRAIGSHVRFSFGAERASPEVEAISRSTRLLTRASSRELILPARMAHAANWLFQKVSGRTGDERPSVEDKVECSMPDEAPVGGRCRLEPPQG